MYRCPKCKQLMYCRTDDTEQTTVPWAVYMKDKWRCDPCGTIVLHAYHLVPLRDESGTHTGLYSAQEQSPSVLHEIMEMAQ